MLAPESDADNKDSFFHGGHWGQCLELLTHLCQYSDSILLITGPEGIGKTALKQALISNNQDKFVYCELHSSKTLTAAEAIESIDKGFDAALQDHISVTAESTDLVLLVDDAQKMSLEVISVLLQLKQTLKAPGNLHIVLFAQPEFEQAIQRSALRGKFTDQVHTIELEPLTLSEVQGFLTHISYDDVDKAICKKIYTSSGGIPGDVIKLAREILDEDQVKQANSKIKRWSPFSVGLTVAFGVVFCLLAFLWPDANDDKFETASMPIMDLPVQTAQVTNIEPSVLNTNDATQQLNLSTSETNTEPQLSQAVELGETPNTEFAAAQQISHDTQAEQLIRLENKLIALQQQLDLEKAARSAAEKKAQQIMQKATEYTKPRAATKEKSSKPSIIGTRHEKYLLSLPSRNYTLQLLGAGNEQKVKQFIIDNKLSSDAYYFATTHNGKSWYIVVYGNYPNLSTATKAASALPSSLQKLRPWAREFSAIQSTIINKG